MRRRGDLLEADYARVVAGGGECVGRVGRVVGVEHSGGTTWVVVDLGGDEVTFNATELEAVEERGEE